MNHPRHLIFLGAVFGAALIAPVAATADSKHNIPPPGPASCAELATDPHDGLAGNPFVKSATSQIIAASGPNTAFCQVDILFGTNTNQNINIRVGLPLNSRDGGTGGVQGAWNGRTQGIGGGGCSGSLAVNGPVNAGYVGSGNDTGHPGGDCEPGVNTDGTYNFQFINDFIRNGMKAQVIFMKSVAKTYYDMRPAYNYWNGCSTGGRQGYVIAQELGTELDGILASAPAMYWTRFQTAQMWGQIAMKDLVGAPIAGAKLDQATASAVAACDANDGVMDGVIDDPRTCTFSAAANICGMPTAPASNCLTPAEAKAIDLIWDGPRNAKGNKIWFGLDRGTSLGGFFGLNGPFPFFLGVVQFHWDEHDRNFDWTTVPLDGYPQVAQDGSRNIADVTDTFGNLDTFRRSGGKMITFVGGNDQLIMPRGVINYYRQMAARYDNRHDHGFGFDDFDGHGNDIDFRDVQKFYRLFRAPGVGHCGGGGAGAWPRNGADFQALVDWVENGVAPNKVIGASAPPAPAITRPLCPYPQTAIYNGSGDQNDASNFHCGGDLETARTVCNDVLVKYKHEVNGDLDFTGTGVNRFECNKVDH
jgi:Tannase and feruloyl esterase